MDLRMQPRNEKFFTWSLALTLAYADMILDVVMAGLRPSEDHKAAGDNAVAER